MTMPLPKITADAFSFHRPFGICFSRATGEAIVDEVCAEPLPRGSGVRLLVTANLDHIVQLRRNSELRVAYEAAWRRTIDGAPVYVYSRLRRADVPCRVTGADLCPQILTRLQPGRHRPFLVLASDVLSDWYREWFSARGFSSEAIRIEVPPFGFERDECFGASLAASIKAHCATHLFFGVGCPKSEVWIHHHRRALGDLYAFAFGAGFEFFAGTLCRAPAFLRRVGLEWAWRLLQDPKRLFRRYFIDSWTFALAILDDIRSPPEGKVQ